MHTSRARLSYIYAVGSSHLYSSFTAHIQSTSPTLQLKQQAAMAIAENPMVENLNVVGVIVISDSDSSDTEDMDYGPGPAGLDVVDEQIDDVVEHMADVIIVSDTDSDSDSEDDRASVIIISDSDEDSGVELSDEVFGEGMDPIPSRLFFYNSHSLVMLTYDRICAGVDNGVHLALINGGGMEVMAHHVTECCLSVSLCCWCCCTVALGVICYTREQLVHQVRVAAQEGLVLCPNMFSTNRYITRRLMYGGFRNPYPDPECHCACC